MAIEQRYQKLKCYQLLTDPYKTCLDKLIEDYAEELNAPIHVGDSLYTPHDFNHHCYNLYRIISNHLCDLRIGADRSTQLSDFELFLLDIAVLFHDYAMSTITTLNVERKTHSADSAQRFLQQWKNSDSSLYKNGQKANMSDNDIRAVAAIIKAHSDEKGPDAPEKTGILAEDLKDEMDSSDPNPVRAKFLAGILRLADELDITSDRIGNVHLAAQLDLDNPDNRVSYQCWNDLCYFASLRNDQEIHTQLNLVLDDKEIQTQFDNGDENNVRSRVWHVKEKIDGELSMIWEKIFQRTEISRTIIRVQKIGIETKLDKRYFQKPSEPVPPLNDDFAISHMEGGVRLQTASKPAAGETSKPAADGPLILSADVQKKLDNFIIQHKLVTTGHFYMEGSWCARDWVDTTKILEQPDLLDACVPPMVQHIKNNFSLENTAILGIDLNGTLMGTRIAAELQCAFALLIPPQKSFNPDSRVKLEQFEHVIYITDAIMSGATIVNVTNQHGLKSKVLGIYALLYRKPIPYIMAKASSGAETENFEKPLFQGISPVYCISDTFSSEVVRKTECTWKDRKTGCIACNKITK